MQQPIFAAIDVLEYPELHDESIPFFTFFRQLNKLFTAAGVKDFALQVRLIPQHSCVGVLLCRVLKQCTCRTSASQSQSGYGGTSAPL